MTEIQRESRKKLLLPLVFLTAMVFILFHAKESRLDLQEGLRLCAENVVPSLFPHLVLSELFVSNLTFSEACIGGQILNHRKTGEVPSLYFLNHP